MTACTSRLPQRPDSFQYPGLTFDSSLLIQQSSSGREECIWLGKVSPSHAGSPMSPMSHGAPLGISACAFCAGRLPLGCCLAFIESCRSSQALLQYWVEDGSLRHGRDVSHFFTVKPACGFECLALCPRRRDLWQQEHNPGSHSP